MTLTALLSLLMAAAPGLAHHGFVIEFDPKLPVVLKGRVTKVELINPHSWIHLKVERDGKPAQEWMVEGGTPNTLLRAGVTKETLKLGTEIVARGFQSRDRSCKPKCKANGRDLTLPDGRKIFIKSSEEAAKGTSAYEEEPAGKSKAK